jgi:multiple sugar transport system ATP-binding protein
MAKVVLKEVDKIYPPHTQALRGVSLEIRDREFVVLVGPSGCGKSTILRIVAGLEEATSGEVWIGDRLVNDVPPRDRDVAMVFQSYALYPHMTAFDNIAFGLRLRKLPKEEIRKRVEEAARILGITELLDKMPRHLSGGQRQRVALGRAIVRKPQVFLFDEPLSNLDAKLRAETRAEISALHRRLQVTTIYVTHDQVEAMTMGERIVVLKDGVVQQVGDPLSIYREPANLFVAGFIGSPPMNFAEVPVTEGPGLDLLGRRVPVPEGWKEALGPYVGRKVILGIRPEDIHLASDGGWPAEVTLVEPTGGEAFVYARLQDRPVIAKAPGQTRIPLGQTIHLDLDLDQAHFFDPQTEERIR